MGGLYSLTLQGNQVGFTTLTAIKAACDARRRHDQVPQAVQEEIFELQPVVPELEVTSAQLSVESLYDQRAIEEIAQLEAELARVQEEIQEAVAESDARFKKLLDDEAKALEEAQVKARDPLPLCPSFPRTPSSLPLLAPSLSLLPPSFASSRFLPSASFPRSHPSFARSLARSARVQLALSFNSSLFAPCTLHLTLGCSATPLHPYACSHCAPFWTRGPAFEWHWPVRLRGKSIRWLRRDTWR